MKMLANNCRYGRVTVYPSDWNRGGKKLLKLEWYIKFRFYDDNRKEQKQIVFKGFNKYEEIEDRREAVRMRLAEIKEDLEVTGWNPIAKTTIKPVLDPENKEINKYTPFIAALRYAAADKAKTVSKETMDNEILFIVGRIETATKELGYENIGIWDIALKHLYLICKKASYKGDVFSGNKFNRNKKVLRQLYPILILLEVAQFNLPSSLPKEREEVKEKTKAFEKSDRKLFDDYLKVHSVRLWLYMRIFFHAGTRSTELLRVKLSDVDFEGRKVRYLVMKGARYEYKDRPMIDASVEFWRLACAGAGVNDYIFGENMEPSTKQFTKNAFKKRWERTCDALGKKIGIYSLKHTHTTEVVNKLGKDKAAQLNAESGKMIDKHYDLEKDRRDNDELLSVDIPFV